MVTRGGLRGGKQLAAAFRKIAESPSQQQRARARERALHITTEVAGRILIINRSDHRGGLRESLGEAQDPTKRSRTLAGARMGTFKGYTPSSISHLVEFPVRPHWQPRRMGGMMHPGHPGYPFLRPAIDYTREPVARAYFLEVFAIITADALKAGGMKRGSRR